MNINVYTDTRDFDNKVRPLLLEKEAENNLPLGLLDQINEGRYEDPFLAVMEDGGINAAVFIRTPPHHLIVTVFQEERIAEIGEVLWDYINAYNISLPGFVGNKKATVQLAEMWSKKTSRPYEVNMRQRIYRLDRLNDIEISEGKMEQADGSEVDLVTQWLMGFTEDTPGKPISIEDASKRAKEMLEEKSVFFWEVEGVPVSMARRARKTDNGITVNFVYTPNKFRRKGYGRSVVAELSSMLLETNQFCTLYTDLDNPTSNKIYMEIGYTPVCDSMMINI
ncbi:GNAT family N-acetyltransferase [Bacillus salacetis]|uniref:GNAT family N-acetyltransferase n=1 Tax=Bacillus salacetis TaxID=2315464 RepID=A0A3A1R0S1_9BACI|nr:GNAT family N-acetyltransferase [Bacillus salacetis]RIW35102.1 GNAT family N-acetyltransferase [Bacillus salacetis]